MRYTLISLLLCIGNYHLYAQKTISPDDSLLVRRIFDEALVRGESYKNLHNLCKDVGHRLSGSNEANEAVVWGEAVLEEMGIDSVYLQEIEVPYWERGDREKAVLLTEKTLNLRIKTLGGSVATPGTLQAPVIEVNSLDEVTKLGEKIKGKIVFYNRPMDPRNISTFDSYGGCVDQRYWGAVQAAEQGAVAVIVRSMTLLEHGRHAHTGSMGYKEGVTKIPAVAVCTEDANAMHEALGKSSDLELVLDINPRLNPNVKSFNVIGEIKGSEYPERVITIGGHLDSWDVGEGAHDDGAGVVHSMEVLRILKDMNYKPKCTIRVVLFMNEENGNMGGKSYARIMKAQNQNIIAAIESDRGGFSPRGFSIKGSEEQVQFVADFRTLLEPYGLHFFEAGFAGVDIHPLAEDKNRVNPDLLLLGLVPDSQRYFDFHHNDDDVFENVNKRELELGCASITAMVYLLDKYLN
jgi:hypothetical protein